MRLYKSLKKINIFSAAKYSSQAFHFPSSKLKPLAAVLASSSRRLKKNIARNRAALISTEINYKWEKKPPTQCCGYCGVKLVHFPPSFFLLHFKAHWDCECFFTPEQAALAFFEWGKTCFSWREVMEIVTVLGGKMLIKNSDRNFSFQKTDFFNFFVVKFDY